MSEAVQEKSRGWRFAEQLLQSHGWERGKGLGRSEDGISEPVKVKVKCDKGGIGHREGEQFSFHWWDHVFNKASSSLQVESDQNGIKLKKTVDEEDGAISNKKPRKSLQNKDKLYGCFVKSATLLSGEEEPEPKSTSSDDSSDSEEEEEEQKLDLSSSTKLSDDDLMKVCGGRTAHKGARHGLTMSAKLARLEQQEAEFLAKYVKKKQTGSSSDVCVAETLPTKETSRGTKKKSKKSKENGVEENGETPETDSRPKKNKKKRKNKQEERSVAENSEANPSKRKKNSEEQNGDGGNRSAEKNYELSDCSVKKKKKKKSAQHDGESAETEESLDVGPIQSDPRTQEEAGAATTTEKRKRKRQKDKRSVEEHVEEVLPSKKNKNKPKALY